MEITYSKTEFGHYEVRFGNAWSGYTIEQNDGGIWVVRNNWYSVASTGDIVFKARTMKLCKAFISDNFTTLYMANEIEYKKRSDINAKLERAKKAEQSSGTPNGTIFETLALKQAAGNFVSVLNTEAVSISDQNRVCNESFGVYAVVSAYMRLISTTLKSVSMTTKCVVDLQHWRKKGSFIMLTFFNDSAKIELKIRISNTEIKIEKHAHLNTTTLGIIHNTGTTLVAAFRSPQYSVQHYVEEFATLLGTLVTIQ